MQAHPPSNLMQPHAVQLGTCQTGPPQNKTDGGSKEPQTKPTPVHAVHLAFGKSFRQRKPFVARKMAHFSSKASSYLSGTASWSLPLRSSQLAARLQQAVSTSVASGSDAAGDAGTSGAGGGGGAGGMQIGLWVTSAWDSKSIWAEIDLSPPKHV